MAWYLCALSPCCADTEYLHIFESWYFLLSTNRDFFCRCFGSSDNTDLGSFGSTQIQGTLSFKQRSSPKEEQYWDADISVGFLFSEIEHIFGALWTMKWL